VNTNFAVAHTLKKIATFLPKASSHRRNKNRQTCGRMRSS